MINKVVMQEIYLTKFDKTNKCSDLYKVKKVVLNQTKGTLSLFHDCRSE